MIYFDNAATTNLSNKVFEKVEKMLKYNYANPSSLHKLGFQAEKEILNTKKIIADILNVNIEEIYFTSGGTEANNLAVFGIAQAYKRAGKTIITTCIEHPSVKNACEKLKEDGFNIVYLNVDEKGYISFDELIQKMTPDTILISIMHVNNEIGTIQNIEKIGEIIKKLNSNIIFHVDGVQSFGKMKINLKNIDLFTASGHKIHAPKGTGFLYIKRGTKIKPLLYGGGQQNGIRPGTENTYGIAGMGVATSECYENLNVNYNTALNIKKEILKILKLVEGISVNGDIKNGSPYILNLSFKDIKGEVFIHALEQDDIYISSGSACNSRQKKHLSTIDYIDKNKSLNSVRFSFSEYNTLEEAEKCVNSILKIIPILRKYKQR